MLKALLLITTSVVFTSAALAQYRWVDKNGKVQYGDVPPSGANATAVRPASSSGSQPESSTGSIAEQEAQFRKRQQEAEKAREKQAKAQQEAEDKRENCARARENLRLLQTGRVSRLDANGERYFLNDAQIAQETARARQAEQQSCS